MECRIGCAACCIEITISSPVPGFPKGKPAGIPCAALKDDGSCAIWGSPEYPEVCRNFRATEEFCGSTNNEARSRLSELEQATSSQTFQQT